MLPHSPGARALAILARVAEPDVGVSHAGQAVRAGSKAAAGRCVGQFADLVLKMDKSGSSRARQDGWAGVHMASRRNTVANIDAGAAGAGGGARLCGPPSNPPASLRLARGHAGHATSSLLRAPCLLPLPLALRFYRHDDTVVPANKAHLCRRGCRGRQGWCARVGVRCARRWPSLIGACKQPEPSPARPSPAQPRPASVARLCCVPA